MWMVLTLVHFQFGVERPAESIMRDHPFDRMFNEQLWPAIPSTSSGFRLVPANKSGKTSKCLLDFLLAGQTNLFRVNDDHEVTRIDVRGEDGLPFPTQEICHRHRDTTQ